MFGDRQPETGKRGVVEAFVLVVVRNYQTSLEEKERMEFQDIKKFWEKRNAVMKDRDFDDDVLEITVIRTEDGGLEEDNGVWLDHRIQIGDPYVQVFCKNDSALLSRINGDCGYAWWPTFGKRIEQFYTCDRCDSGIEFDDVAVSMRGRDVHSGTTIEDMPFEDERY